MQAVAAGIAGGLLTWMTLRIAGWYVERLATRSDRWRIK